MKTITATEFKRNFGKYALLAKHEELEIVKKGEVLFHTVPPKAPILATFESLLGILPADASIGVDPDERG